MHTMARLKTGLIAATFGLTALIGHSALATTVQFQTVMGDFEVNLYDETTPETVANFLRYVENEAYNMTVIHRSVPGFIVQGGGFSFEQDDEVPQSIDTYAPVTNEPQWSNRRGTIAMAKLGSSADSATSQWFINLSDNHENLDVQNGGFTVFGEVVGDGMDVVDAMAELDRFNFGGAFTTLPLRDYGEAQLEEEKLPDLDHLVTIDSIQVLDASSDTAADLEPVPNTLINAPSESSSSSSGSVSWWLLAVLAGLGARRVRRGYTATES